MNKKFEEFIDETKQRLLAYEMDESCFDDYDDKDREMMKRLREVLYGNEKTLEELGYIGFKSPCSKAMCYEKNLMMIAIRDINSIEACFKVGRKSIALTLEEWIAVGNKAKELFGEKINETNNM